MLYNKAVYDEYIKALINEISMFKGHPDFIGRKVTAIYFGGGTASLLEPKDVESILGAITTYFPVSRDAEITVESHPSTLNPQKLGSYKDAGVNRLSIGVQSFNDNNLKNLGRTNNERINESALNDAKAIGFRRIVIDFMYHLPKQTMADFLNDLKKIDELAPDGLSAYSLVAGETPFESKLKDIQPDKVDQEMYYAIKDHLESLDYAMFTPYDFAKKGKECRYVMNAWKSPQQLLLGFGAGAQSHYFGGYISTNIYPVNTYVKAVNSGILPWMLGSHLTKEDLMAKYMVLGVRGLEINKIIATQ